MPEIEIRPADAGDIPVLVGIEHDYKSSYVWQMDLVSEDGQIRATFRDIRLPRPVTVEYPRNPQSLLADWEDRSGLLVAILQGEPIGYVALDEAISPKTAWITDLVVAEAQRRKGIASALVLAAQEWARTRKNRRVILEMQSKNYAGIRLCAKLGYEFCGYNDHYYANQDIALFFAQYIR
jgi:ribosomal protein S18 acetylase RimI-like enzyme